MYHSITIGEKNTWDDWHLIARSRPFFAPPKQKTKYLEIPGTSGSIDISNSLSGYPLYNNREGSIDFTVLNAVDIDNDDYDYKYQQWPYLYSEIMGYLDGKRLRAVLEDEPEYYYEGVFSVTGYKPGDSESNPRTVITMSYNLDPYKWRIENSIEDWKWDTFNFYNGIVYPKIFKDITILNG